MVYKGNKKDLTNPNSFREITVCAQLGKIKEMVLCDLTLPVLRPLKAKSQLGFTAGLFIKAANIMVTEKRAIALVENVVVLHQFLDATQAFDRSLHPVILRELYNSRISDDKWRYFYEMHKNSKKVVKWKGELSEMFSEDIGVRQGGICAPNEYLTYVNPNLKTLESLAGLDTMAGHPTSILCVADDEPPSTSSTSPRLAISDMQVLLLAVETHGTSFHISYGVPKCKLLVSARPSKKKQTLEIVQNEPESLTFFNKPVALVEDNYIH